MTRMSREFGLVLLGSTMLGGAYALSPSPEKDMEEKGNREAAQRTGHHYRHGGGFFLWVHSPAYAGSPTGRPHAYSPTARTGGFGSVGRTFSGGS